jgi:hypothetical protein
VNEEFDDADGRDKWIKFGAMLAGMASIHAVRLVTKRIEAL